MQQSQDSVHSAVKRMADSLMWDVVWRCRDIPGRHSFGREIVLQGGMGVGGYVGVQCGGCVGEETVLQSGGTGTGRTVDVLFFFQHMVDAAREPKVNQSFQEKPIHHSHFSVFFF